MTEESTQPVEQQTPEPIPAEPSVQESTTVPVLKSFQKIPVAWEKLLPLILASLAILTGISLFLIIQRINYQVEEPKLVTIIVTPTPSPTPLRIATNLSTSSAYLSFNEQVSSLSANITTFEREDPSLFPPSLVLPLGFQK